MKLPPFDYVRPEAVDDALAALQDEEARVLAGGQSLLPLMALRLARPERLVDVSRLDELRGIRHDPGTGRLHIGAAVTHRQVMSDLAALRAAPFLRAIGAHIGHEAIRARGTLGGSVAHADPAAEWAALAVAANATLELRSSGSRRLLRAAGFFDGAYSTTIQPGELLTSVTLDAARLGRVGFAEVARRPGDFALAGAIWVTGDGQGGGPGISVTVFGLTYRPVRLPLPGRAADLPASRDELIAAACAQLDDIGGVRADLHASEELRRHLTRQMIARACAAALDQTGATDAD